jgi:Glycosyltransferase Family 4
MEENRVRGGDRSPPRFSNFEERDSIAREFESQTHSNVNRQHICVVTETYPPEINGVAITLSRLVGGLRARGNKVSVVHPRQRNAQSAGGMLDPESDDIQVRGLPLPGYRGLQFGMPAGSLLQRVWSHHRPAAVYVATEGPLGWSAVRTAQGMRIPL